MPTHHMNDKNRISKANRPKSQIILRRASKMLSKRNPDLMAKISTMRLTIAPIVHVESGVPAPDFPETMLSLFLLTENQLDAMAHYYNQVTPSELTHQYPQTMTWDQSYLSRDPSLPDDCRLDDLERLKMKMRMFARFVGIRGTETPTWEYERRVEVLRNKIRRSIREEEMSLKKFYRGPRTYL